MSTSPSEKPDIVLIGAGIMSATLGTMLKELEPSLDMVMFETLHNAALNPTRAEVEVQVEVLRDGDARNNPAVQEALNFTNDNRKQLSRLFLDRTAAQNTIVPTV